MKYLYLKKSFFTFFLVFAVFMQIQAQSSSVHFDLDACDATIITGDNMDYSEFTGVTDNSACADLEVLGGHLYRNNPAMNKHSCTPGAEGPAMCIGSFPSCTFTPGVDEALLIDIMVSPGSSGNATLSELSFYEQAPTEYNWINGASGPNDYPTLFAVRILKNGVQVYLSANIPTQLTWNFRTFNFSSIPEFTVSEPTIFNIELLPYCPVGNGEPVSAWDIDEIRILANCCDNPSGGTLSGGPFEFCVGDGVPDHVSGIELTGQTGDNSQWVVTDENNNILSLPSSPDSVNFDGGGSGICLIWHVSFDNGLSGLIVGNNLLTDLAGCYGLSNSVTVVRNDPEGGTLTGGPFEFCVGDSVTDVTSIILSGNAGANSQLVVTDDLNVILGMPGSLEEVEFPGGTGTFLIWNISFFDPLTGFAIGNNLLTDVTGCLGLSNSITVSFIQPEGGTLSGGPFEFCVGDSIPDHVSGIILSGNAGANSQWVVTNEDNMILSLPSSPDSVNFDGGGPGICLIWHVSYFDPLTGLIPGNNLLTDLSGCFDISNSITVIRNQPEGGTLTGGPFEFCVGDGIPDVVSGVVLSGNAGSNSQWVVTNDSNVILSLPLSLDSVNFDGGGPGICLIWNISYFGTLSGLVPGNNLLSDLSGCFDLSNSITVVRNQPDGGVLTGGPFEFCVGDGIPDHVTGVVLTGNTGPNSQWVITNDSNVILSLPLVLDSVNFDGGGQGICLIWNVSYFDTLSGFLPGNNLLTDLGGCFDLSNSITVVRNEPQGGELTGGPFEFCIGDTITDVTSLILSGNAGETSQWVVTDDLNVILSMPGSLGEAEFVGGTGTFLIWNISFFGTLSGFEIGNNLLTDVTGCLGLSNSVTVSFNQPEGGELTGGPFEFCVGDSIPDFVSGVVLSGNVGSSSQWVITNDSNMILSLPVSLDSVNFDGGGPGICLIWNVSYFGTLSGLTEGNNLLSDLSGCFDLSNSITVVRNEPLGGVLTGGPFEFCIGDSLTDVTSIILSGNAGETSQFVVTDDLNIILSMPGSLDEIEFVGVTGTFYILNISFFDTLSGFEIGNNLFTDVTGCLGLSNPITVSFNEPDGGELTGGPFEFCVGDSIPDIVSGVELSGTVGTDLQWVITNDSNMILSLPISLDSVNFDGGGAGICLIWNVSSFGAVEGLVPGNNLLSDLSGCFDLSNSITVVRNQPEGGELTGGPFEFCVGDSIPDFVTGVELLGNVGANSQYVVTDSVNNILSLPNSPEEVDFNEAPPGTCLIWHVSYDGTLTGLEVDNNLLTDLEGCFSISNSITVVRVDCEGFQGENPVFELRINPNPVRDIMTLQMLDTGDERPLIEVFDASGRVCLKQFHEPGGEMRIDISHLADGHYFVRVQSQLGIKTESILLIR